jgi:hypothetical protein
MPLSLVLVVLVSVLLSALLKPVSTPRVLQNCSLLDRTPLLLR